MTSNFTQLNPPHANHQPFSWLAEELRIDATMQFLAQTLDITQGVETCLGLVHASNLAREEKDPACPPALNVPDTERLTRLAMAAAALLAQQTEQRIDVLNRRYEQRAA
ncbi:MAG: hypothetical protein JWQ61_1250 [Collimonas fungivorans]|uniref:hypothetical protein n=1 Tax=Collimonas fungivorans TaxID=158899 RepID=UPI0026F2B596|nr:hypothetical protein [Collimonas fungivorans]MDB5766436.1 hypothetical protein [Collimonas fungivorans]